MLLTVRDSDALRHYIDILKERRITGVMAEIGCYAGVSTSIFAEHFDHVIAIDPFEPWKSESKDRTSCKEHLQSGLKQFQRVLEAHKNISHIRLPSEKAAELFDKDAVDFVYLDANHDYQAVLRDIWLWHRVGKVLGGHDYDHSGGVTEALDDMEVDVDVYLDGNWIEA